MMPALARPSWRGRTNVDAITVAAIEAAEKIAGHTFVVTQGSYQGGAGDPLSGGTHDGGGVVDIRWTGHDRDVLALRKVGFAAWHRTPAQGRWPHHIHAVLIGHPLLSRAAANQVASYLRGRNGLKYERPDDGPRLTPIPRFTYPPEEDDMKPEDIRHAPITVLRGKNDRPVEVTLENVLSDLEATQERIMQAIRDLAKTIKEKS